MNAFAVDVQAIAELDFTGASFAVTVTAPEGFDQAARRAIRRAVARASEWNAENEEATPRVADSAAYRVVAIHAKDADTYVVDVQAATWQNLDGAPFTVRVDEAKGFGQAARRAVRNAVARANEWNVANPDAAPRATGEGAYRVLRVELVV